MFENEDKERAWELTRILNIKNPDNVYPEVESLIYEIYPDYDASFLRQSLEDILNLYHGTFPGYRECNTPYHDLNHTMDVFLAMARIIHGHAIIETEPLPEKYMTIGLISALMHDTGLIQKIEDTKGTGAKYNNIHVRRSIEFFGDYMKNKNLSDDEINAGKYCINCTDIKKTYPLTEIEDSNALIIGRMLLTADLKGQLADRVYLEKLPFLFEEFKEEGVEGFESPIHLMISSPNFYSDFVKKRIENPIDFSDYYKAHFENRFKDQKVIGDLYQRGLERNNYYLQQNIKTPDDINIKLRRNIK